ncbi:hypothetical protein CBL_11818 [Carabus blaptoides fortunei]
MEGGYSMCLVSWGEAECLSSYFLVNLKEPSVKVTEAWLLFTNGSTAYPDERRRRFELREARDRISNWGSYDVIPTRRGRSLTMSLQRRARRERVCSPHVPTNEYTMLPTNQPSRTLRSRRLLATRTRFVSVATQRCFLTNDLWTSHQNPIMRERTV